MNSPSKLGVFLACALASSFSVLALTVNDGSTTTNLVQINNSSPRSRGDAVVSLDVLTNSVLKAYQTGTSFFFAFRSAWYASGLVATGGVYTVAADFQPATDNFVACGGVMGWLSLTSSNGITLQVIPNYLPTAVNTFRVSVVDFSATNGNANDSLSHLFNKTGTAATEEFGSALSAAGANYSTTNFATFQLAFAAPTAADLAALSNATAHITARVLQTTNTGGAPVQVGQTIELLTDLPQPTPTVVHRLGYFAVWGDTSAAGEEPPGFIGYLDNLTAQGSVGLPPNNLPAVSISSPTNGATFTEPADITIIADATDTDGTVTRVDFFAGTNFLGTATAINSLFGFDWTNVAAGSYSLTAQATDDRGGTATSAPVIVNVSSSAGGPTLIITQNGNTIDISWLTTGYQLQMKTNLSELNWVDVPNTTNITRVTIQITGGSMFFRLVQAGAPGGPRLTIQVNGNTVTVSWPAVAGYRFQAKSDLNTVTWTDLTTSSNQFTETITSPMRFYRLINP